MHRVLGRGRLDLHALPEGGQLSRRLLAGAGGVLLAGATAALAWFLLREAAPGDGSVTAAPAVGAVLLSYPVAHAPEPFPAGCGLSCGVPRTPAGKTHVLLGTEPDGYFYVDQPPGDCGFLVLRFRPDAGVTDATAPVYLGGSPRPDLEACNPGARLDHDMGQYQVPAWYRTGHAVVLSIPGRILRMGMNYRVNVCARDQAGQLLEFTADNDGRPLRPVAIDRCR